MTSALRWLSLLLLGGLLCAQAQAGLIGTDQEKKIGRQVADELEKQYGLVRGEAMVEKVRAVGGKVAAYAKQDRPKIDYAFNVLDNKEINAVACPGGYMYAYRGLVEKMPEEELLAAVLAHESAHVAERHGMQTLERTLGWSLLLGVLTGSGQSDLGNVGLGILMKGYSREQEAEADRVGHVYLYKAGYDIGAMVRMLERLRDLTKEGGEMPGFLRSHPSDATRIGAARRREAEILLELGSERPAADPPHLAIVYQPAEGEEERQTDIGEALAMQLSQMLDASAQFDTEFGGARESSEADRVAALAQIATEGGFDGAIGVALTEAALRTEGTGRSAAVRIRLSVTMTVVAAGATEAETTYSYATGEEKRKADETRRIEAAIQALTQEAAKALAVEALRPTPVEATG